MSNEQSVKETHTIDDFLMALTESVFLDVIKEEENKRKMSFEYTISKKINHTIKNSKNCK
jgi:hypothetical protein